MISDFEGSITRIFTKDKRIIGAGFQVSKKRILTCAHVIVEALDIPPDTTEAPSDEIYLDFPLVACGEYRKAKVIKWVPVKSDGMGDIAYLEIIERLPRNCRCASFIDTDNVWGHRFRAFGFPPKYDSGIWVLGELLSKNSDGWIQIKGIENIGFFLQPGFSGTPIWDEEINGVIGVAIAAEAKHELRTAFILQTSYILKELPELKAKALLPCPYRSLFAFREKDEEFFYGRDIYTKGLINRIEKESFIAIIGASGCGKSSVVYAGLIPHLRRQGNWLTANFRPGEEPLRSLSRSLIPFLYTDEIDIISKIEEMIPKLKSKEIALKGIIERILEKTPDKDQFLLFIDQFEELYTRCKEEKIQKDFIDQLLNACREKKKAFHILITMRADFLGKALSYRPFADLLQNSDLKLGPMNRDELRKTIVSPARKLGVAIKEDLTERILDDVGYEPGNLPLLEFALDLLWKKQENQEITHNSYKNIGGVKNALTHYADKILKAFTPPDMERIKIIFTQLVSPGEGTEDTRRMAPKAQIGEKNWDLIKELADKRLVVTGYNEDRKEETVELVHEALIKNWVQLREWMDEERDFRSWQERLRTFMNQWIKSRKDNEALLRGPFLAEAEGWINNREKQIGLDEKEFIEESLRDRDRLILEREALREKEIENAKRLAEEAEARRIAEEDRAKEVVKRAEEAKKREKIERKFKNFLVYGFIIVVLLSFFAAVQQGKIVRAKFRAEHAERLSKERIIDEQNRMLEVNSQLLEKNSQLLEEKEQSFSKKSRSNAIDSLMDDDFLVSSHYFAKAEKYTHDNFKTFKTKIAVLNISACLESLFLKSQLKYKGAIKDARFSEDNSLILNWNSDKLLSWNKDGIPTFNGPIDPNFKLYGVSVNSDCSVIVTWGREIRYDLWDKKGKPVSKPKPPKIIYEAQDYHYPFQGIQRWDNELKIFYEFSQDPKDYFKFIRLKRKISTDDLSEFDTIIDTSNLKKISDRKFQFINIMELRAHRSLFSSFNKIFRNTIFRPEKFLRKGEDGKIKLYPSGDELIQWYLNEFDSETPTFSDGQFPSLKSIGFLYGLQAMKDEDSELVKTSNNSHILTQNNDGKVKLWNKEDNTFISIPIEGELQAGAINDDGSLILTKSVIWIAMLWKKDDGTLISNSIRQKDAIKGCSINRDGSLILTWSEADTAMLWNKDGKALSKPMKHKYLQKVILNHDGSLILTLSDLEAKWWNEHGSSISHLPTVGIEDATFSNDGSLVLTWGSHETKLLSKNGSFNKSLQILIRGATFSNDDSLILTWGYGEARLWDKEGNKYSVSMQHKDPIRGAIISNDNSLILTWDENGTAKLWNNNGTPASQCMHHEGQIEGASFSSDKSLILTWDKNGVVKSWYKNDTPFFKPNKDKEPVEGVVFSNDCSMILSWTKKGLPTLWDKDGTQICPLNQPEGSVKGAIFSNDDSLILIWNNDKGILWEKNDTINYDNNNINDTSILTKGKNCMTKLWKEIAKLNFQIKGATISSDGSKILAWSKDGTYQFFDRKGKPLSITRQDLSRIEIQKVYEDGSFLDKNNQPIPVFQLLSQSKMPILLSQYIGLKQESIKKGVFSPKGSGVLICSSDGIAKLWDLQDYTFISIPMAVEGATFSNDGIMILIWRNNKVHILEYDNKKSTKVHVMQHEGIVKGARFSNYGSLILSWSDDGTARLWNKYGVPVSSFMKHNSPVKGATFNHDDSLIITWTDNGKIMLWDKDGILAYRPTIHKNQVNDAIFSSDGSYIITYSVDKKIRWWDIRYDYDFPKDALTLMVEAITGTLMDDNGAIKDLSPEVWLQKIKNYIDLNENILEKYGPKKYKEVITSTLMDDNGTYNDSKP